MALKSNTLTSSRKTNTVVLTWVIMLVGSMMPNILWNQFAGSFPVWLNWVKIGLLAGLVVLSFIIGELRSLRPFAAVILVYVAVSEIIAWYPIDLAVVASSLSGTATIHGLISTQLGKLIVSVVVILALVLLGFNREQMFLVRGNLRAPIKPVVWMGFPKPDSWLSFGGQWSVYLALGVGAALWITSRTPLGQLLEVSLPLLPVILLLAVLNAFNEEVVFRSGILSTTEESVGRMHSWWLSALYFGIAHFWGVPYGWIGVGLATFMGWILAKAMLETRGFFWSWWIHFLQDVVIFIFIVAGTVTPGG